MKKFLITGGAGFIGSALIRYIIENTQDSLINLDKLTYAGNLSSLQSVSNNPRYAFKQVDICDRRALDLVFSQYQPDGVIHLAAESHVDRSINAPADFITTNIVGTYNLLESARHYWDNLSGTKKSAFRFLHISTDEVYGDMAEKEGLSTETAPYNPSSPYSASKASSAHLVCAWLRTYGFPTIVTNSSNNYGPYQFPEKLIPLIILKAIKGQPLPLYGNGLQTRDWLFVEDHAKALYQVITQSEVGKIYNIASHQSKSNLEVVNTICAILEELVPNKPLGVKNYADLICYVQDRPGHDVRYALDASKIKSELGWQAQESFESGIRKTIKWYLSNPQWWNLNIAQ